MRISDWSSDVCSSDLAADPLIPRPFRARALGGRRASRRALETQFGLDRDDAPIFIIVSRLTWQKGMDMVMDAIDHLVGLGGKLALLGSGDHPLEGAFLAAADRHRGRVGARIGYDEPLSHLMQAGRDAILTPSRLDRTIVVSGTECAVRFDLGVRRFIYTNTLTTN